MTRGALALVAALVAFAGAGCVENPERVEIARTGSSIVIAPFEMHEECIPLAAGERIEFRFRSTTPLDFDIHLHEGNALIVPLSRSQTIDEAGDFTPDRDAIHCLVWEAGPEGSVLEFRIRPLPAPE